MRTVLADAKAQCYRAEMKLRDHIQTLSPEGKRTLASAVGVQVIYLHQLSSGFRQPSPELAIRIEAATNGAVTCEELRSDVPWHVLRGKAAA